MHLSISDQSKAQLAPILFENFQDFSRRIFKPKDRNLFPGNLISNIDTHDADNFAGFSERFCYRLCFEHAKPLPKELGWPPIGILRLTLSDKVLSGQPGGGFQAELDISSGLG